MSKFIHDDAVDAKLQYIIDNCDGIYVCTSDVMTTGAPDWTKITSTNNLISMHAMLSGDFSITDGDVSGRKLVVAEQADLAITADGTAESIVLVDSGTTKVLAITECPAEALLNGNLVTITTFDIEDEDPQP